MRKVIYKIDEYGFIRETLMGEFDGKGELTNLSNGNYITVDLPQPLQFYRPRWSVDKWVEGETVEEKAEREAQQLLESLKPSPSEIEDAELEIKLITILTELGVTQ